MTAGATEELLKFMGYETVDKPDDVTRLAHAAAATAPTSSTSRRCPSAPRADLGAGSVHHIAFAVENRAKQLEVRKALIDTGYQVTPVIDRDYFWAIYFRTPGGVLFEVATNEPGFDRDEDTAHLGEALKLPQQHAHLRDLTWKSTSQPLEDRTHVRADLQSATAICTAQDARSPGGPLFFAVPRHRRRRAPVPRLRQRELLPGAHRSSRRAATCRNMARRASSGAPARASTTWTTLPARPTRWRPSCSAHAEAPSRPRCFGLGYSNGANILASTMFATPDLFDAAVLMHPLIPFEPKVERRAWQAGAS